MKRLIMVAVMVLVLAGSVYAADYSYESITVANSAIGISAGYIPNSLTGCQPESWSQFPPQMWARCTLETAQIRFRHDGTNPTAAEGHPLNAGDILILDSCKKMFYFKAIRTGATSGILKCTYGR